MATYEELLQRARTIKTESSDRANTAVRVGSWMVDALDYIKDGLDGKADERYEELTTLAKTVEGAINELNANPGLSGEILEQIQNELAGKQDILVAGSGITIVGNRISATGGGGGGGADWGEIGGTLSDQADLAAALAGKADASHTHAQSEVTGLTTALAGKADASHTHAQSEVTGLTAALAGKADASHTHAQSEVTGLTAALAEKQNALTAGANITIVNDVISATGGGGGGANWGEIGGSMADQDDLVEALSGKASITHTHSQSDVEGLSTALAGKANSTHSHAISDVTSLQSTLNGKQDSLTVGRGLNITSNVISTPKAVLQNEIVHTDSTPSYTSNKTSSPYYHQILSIPASSFSLVMNVTGNILGFPYNTTLYITSTNYQYSLVSLFKLGFVLAIDNDNDLIYLCNNKLKTHNSTPGRNYTFQIVEYTGSESIIWTEESTILDTTGMTIEEEVYVKVEQLSTDTVTFNVNSNPATWITTSSKLNYMGNISTNSVEDLVLHCHNNLTANSQIKLVFTKDITNSLTIKNSNGTTTFCTIDSPIYAGSIVNLTAVSDTTNGWLASVDSAALYSSDHSVILTQYNSKTDITLPSTVIRNHYYDPAFEADGIPNDNQLAIGDGTTTVYQAVAMGYYASALGIDSVAIGYFPKSSANSVCIGYHASDVRLVDAGEYESGNGQNVAIGQFAQLTPTSGRAISIGIDSKVGYKLGGSTSDTENDHGWASIAIGAGAEAHNSYCTAIGFEAEAKGYDDIAIGDSAVADSGLYDSNASYDDGKNGHSIAIGRSAIAKGQQTVIGSFNEIDEDAALVIGDGEDEYNRHNLFVLKRDGQLIIADNYSRIARMFCLVLTISYNSSTQGYDFDFNDIIGGSWSNIETILEAYASSISTADEELDSNMGYNSDAKMDVRYNFNGSRFNSSSIKTAFASNSYVEVTSYVTFHTTDSGINHEHDFRVKIIYDKNLSYQEDTVTLVAEDITDWYGTQAQYDALTSITEGRNYFIINNS